MAKRNHSPDPKVYGEDDEQSSSSDQSGNYSLSQPVTDERSPDPQHMTNQQIDECLINQLDDLVAIRNGLLSILCCYLIYQYLYLFALGFLVYQVVNHRQSADGGDSSASSSCQYEVLNVDRDAQAESRVAHPVNVEIEFSPTTDNMTNIGQLSRQTTPPPSPTFVPRQLILPARRTNEVLETEQTVTVPVENASQTVEHTASIPTQRLPKQSTTTGCPKSWSGARRKSK